MEGQTSQKQYVSSFFSKLGYKYIFSYFVVHIFKYEHQQNKEDEINCIPFYYCCFIFNLFSSFVIVKYMIYLNHQKVTGIMAAIFNDYFAM